MVFRVQWTYRYETNLLKFPSIITFSEALESDPVIDDKEKSLLIGGFY